MNSRSKSNSKSHNHYTFSPQDTCSSQNQSSYYMANTLNTRNIQPFRQAQFNAKKIIDFHNNFDNLKSSNGNTYQDKADYNMYITDSEDEESTNLHPTLNSK